jgi:YgiT-type zinc finger domain-containing protein
MKTQPWNETFEERLVTYTQEMGGRFVIIEHVPARVCRETGEQLFSPAIVTKIQNIIRAGVKPARVIETPVYEFSETVA